MVDVHSCEMCGGILAGDTPLQVIFVETREVPACANCLWNEVSTIQTAEMINAQKRLSDKTSGTK